MPAIEPSVYGAAWECHVEINNERTREWRKSDPRDGLEMMREKEEKRKRKGEKEKNNAQKRKKKQGLL